MDIELAWTAGVGVGGALLFAVLAVQLRRGRWLNLIAGNYFVTKEEAKTPEQRKLGRRVSILLVPCIVLCALIAVRALAERAGIGWLQTACDALVAVAMVVFAVMCVRYYLDNRRAWRAGHRKLLEEDPSRSEDVRVDLMQERVILGIPLFMLAVSVLAVVFGAPSD